MSLLELTYIDGPTVRALALTDAEILDAVRDALTAQARGETVLEPRTHLFPLGSSDGHFNVLRGGTPRFAGVKVVGDFVANHERGLESEHGLLLLLDPETGVPAAVIDATELTAMRTGAVTALGAQALARPDATVLAHIGARGTAYWNVRLCRAVLPSLEQVRVHSRRADSRDAFAARLRHDLHGVEVTVCEDWESTVRGADVVVEASRLREPEPLLRTEWIAEGALVVPYGTVSAVELSLTDIMAKVVVDDWNQAQAGPLGALRAHVDSGRLTEQTLHAELGQVLAGMRPGRESAQERILLWHRGLSTTDIALGEALLDKAVASGVGTLLPYRD